MRYWRSRSIYCSAIRTLSRLGYNPMQAFTDHPSSDYGQLVAECVKR